MNERVKRRSEKAKRASVDALVANTGLPGGMSMLREQTGAWTIRDSEGQVRGLGRDPEGAIFAVFKVTEVRSVLSDWNSFQQIIKEGGEIDLK